MSVSGDGGCSIGIIKTMKNGLECKMVLTIHIFLDFSLSIVHDINYNFCPVCICFSQWVYFFINGLFNAISVEKYASIQYFDYNNDVQFISV